MTNLPWCSQQSLISINCSLRTSNNTIAAHMFDVIFLFALCFAFMVPGSTFCSDTENFSDKRKQKLCTWYWLALHNDSIYILSSFIMYNLNSYVHALIFTRFCFLTNRLYQPAPAEMQNQERRKVSRRTRTQSRKSKYRATLIDYIACRTTKPTGRFA